MLMRSEVCNSRQRGFSLIEVLIAVAVLSFGLLAIGAFHAKLLNESGYSKARAEAIALAQDKIDALRNYTTEHGMVGNLNNNPVKYPATPDVEYVYPDDIPANATTTHTTIPGTTDPDVINGVNADFTRTLTVTNAGDISSVYVVVSWVDRAGERQEVKLESDLAWKNPRGTADVAETSEPLVESPTGKAYLGDGSLTAQEMTDKVIGKDGTIDNNDGTLTADYDGDGDLELIVVGDDGSGEVALTLPSACKVDGGCTDFVKISGTVFFDTATSKLDASAVYVLASDAAYCSRWAPTGVLGNKLVTTTDLGTSQTALPGTDDKVYRDNDITADHVGNNDPIHINDYRYFNYTCYIGGGWYGNIGLAMTAANVNRTDYACVGDPDNPDNLRWKRVELAKRRVYRGMLHQYTINSTTGAHEAVKDSDGNTLYTTIGIKDAAIMPDINWSERYQGHDFVIANGNSATSDDCMTVLTRPDANWNPTVPNLFSKGPGDFICLNADYENDTTGTYAAFTAYPWHYLNTFDMTRYDAARDCPYDPSDPPSTRYTIVGSLQYAADATVPSDPALWRSINPADADPSQEGTMNTSDGFGNCMLTSIAGQVVNFECDYYVWTDKDGIETPWSGNVKVTTPLGSVCAPSYNPTDLQVASKYEYPDGITSTQSAIFVCDNLANYDITGVITIDAGNTLSESGVTVTAVSTPVDGSDPRSVDCLTTQVGTGVNYTCNVLELAKDQGYTGTVTITLPTDVTCESVAASAVATGSTCSGNTATFSFTDLGVDSSINNVVTDGPLEQYTFYGKVLNGDSATTMGTLSSLSATNGAECKIISEDASAVNYACIVTVDQSTTTSWTGTVNIGAPSGYWCGTDTADTAVTGTNITDGGSLPDVTCNPNTGLPINIAVTVEDAVNMSTYELFLTSETSVLLIDSGNALTCTLVSIGTADPLTNLADLKYSCVTDSKTLLGDTWSGSLIVETVSTHQLCYQGAVATGDTIALNTVSPLDNPQPVVTITASGAACP